jgi:hypothetical protein
VFIKRVTCIFAVLLTSWTVCQGQTVSNYVEYGDEDLCNTGTYSSDPKAGATLIGLAADVVTHATLAVHHSYPFSPNPTDYPGTDQIYVGHVQTAGHDGYSQSGGRLNAPQVITLDYSSLIPAGQTVATLTLGIGADDFQFPAWGQPFTAKINGATNAALTAALNGLNQTGPYEQFLTLGIAPSLLQANHVLTLSIDEGGDGGDGWAIDFLTVGITTVRYVPGVLRAALGSGASTISITLASNIVGAVMETTTNLPPLVAWTPIWTNAGVTNISFPILYKEQFFRLRE